MSKTNLFNLDEIRMKVSAMKFVHVEDYVQLPTTVTVDESRITFNVQFPVYALSAFSDEQIHSMVMNEINKRINELLDESREQTQKAKKPRLS